MPSALPKVKKYTWYLSTYLIKYAAKRQPQGLCGKIVLRVGIFSFSKVSPEILTDVFNYVILLMYKYLQYINSINAPELIQCTYFIGMPYKLSKIQFLTHSYHWVHFTLY